MDEVLFRSSQRIENLQVQVELAATKSKDLIQQLSQQSRSAVLNAWNSSKLNNIKTHVREVWIYLVEIGREIQGRVFYILNPNNLINIFARKWTRRDMYFGCAGLIIGGCIGFAIGLSLRKKRPVYHYMQAVQCSNYMGVESACIIEDAIAPSQCGDYEVLVNVKAASVHVVDAQICTGYGRNLRRILRRLYKQSNSDLPVILGRDCSGIVSDLGCKVKRLEVGDEVWLTVPFWAQGTLSQTVLVSESRIGKKPKNIGFEGACSLPYAGSLALSVLEEAQANSKNAFEKRFFIIGGCTPVGCVLIQILKHWRADITTSCYKRALPVAKALGATDIVIVPDPQESDSDEEESLPNILYKELELKSVLYDVIINTNDNHCDVDVLRKFCTNEGAILTTLPPVLATDSCGFFANFLLDNYIWIKYLLLKLVGLPLNEFDETHLCHVSLDTLADFVENGHLQTVVDKVFHAQDIEVALNHIQSPQSIGSTVITFR